jgi:hypothetical protein
MKLINFKSNFQLTPFSPNYNYFIFENDITNKVDINEILNNMLSIETELLKDDKNVDKSDSEKKVMTLRYKFFNEKIFKMKYMINLINVLKENIYDYSKILHEKIPENLWVQIWCNILRKDQSIDIHQHNDSEHSYLSGNLCLQSNNTKTHYINPQNYFKKFNPEYSSENKKGKLTIFPSTIPHCTDSVKDNDIRVSIAFDVMIENDIKKILWEKQNNDLFRENVFKL